MLGDGLCIGICDKQRDEPEQARGGIRHIGAAKQSQKSKRSVVLCEPPRDKVIFRMKYALRLPFPYGARALNHFVHLPHILSLVASTYVKGTDENGERASNYYGGSD